MAPVLFKWIPYLNKPIDAGKTFRNQRIFGDHKTWRGLLSGIIISILVCKIQALFYPNLTSIALINYEKINEIMLGFLLGLGSLSGDLVKSFLKRQFKIAPGRSWMPFDQIDWIIGSNLLISFYIQLSYPVILSSILILGLLHPAINILGYLLRIKKNVL